MAQKTRGVAHVNHTSKSIPLADISSVKVELDLSDSDLELNGGVGSLVEADFYYDERERESPQISYSEMNQLGSLTIHDVPPRRRRYRDDVTENRWIIQLNETIPVDLRAGSASGDCVLDCDDINLTHLYVATSSGDLDIGLSSEQQQLLEADVVASSGDIKFDASGEFPALQKLGYRSSSGDVKVNLGGKFGALERMDVNHSSGNIRTKLDGTFQNPMTLYVRNTNGDCYVDLRGTWEADAEIILKQTAGDVSLRLPSDVGVKVVASTVSGNIRAKDMSRQDKAWVNDVYGDTDVKLMIKITSVSGDIQLR